MGFFSKLKKFFGVAAEPAADDNDNQDKNAVAGLKPEENSASLVRTGSPGFEAGHSSPQDNCAEGEGASMLISLRSAEPKLSAWLEIVLEGVEGADELLWKRLRFLLTALQAPEDEAAAFVDDFKRWLGKMERHKIRI